MFLTSLQPDSTDVCESSLGGMGPDSCFMGVSKLSPPSDQEPSERSPLSARQREGEEGGVEEWRGGVCSRELSPSYIVMNWSLPGVDGGWGVSGRVSRNEVRDGVGDGVDVDDRVLGQRVRLPLEHRQPVEPLERLLAPICAATAAWTSPAKSVTGRATTRSLRGGGRAPGAQSIAA